MHIPSSLHIETPLIESKRLRANGSLWLKLENTQPTGSFKCRGIGHACSVYLKQGARRFVSSSGGNAGLAVAYAGRNLNVPVTVIVPETTTSKAKELIQMEQAEVIVYGSSWMEAHKKALSLVDSDTSYIHPFDDPLLWKGHSSLITEIVAKRAKPDAIVVSVGGGGLFSGITLGLQKENWGDVPVVAVETIGADSLFQSIQYQALIELESICSIATSLGAKRVAKKAFEESMRHPTTSLVVSDREAIAGCRSLLEAHNFLVEPACGAAIAAAISLKESDVIVIVCGGIGVSVDLLAKWESTLSTGN